MQTDWDYIVVGSGSAGAAVASRLSEDGKTQVLLLEAGRKDTSIIYKVPILGPMIGLKDKNSDWGFKTEADPSRQGRIDHWPRGKVLGGSSSINGTIYVRGNRGDYDHWRQLGNVGWSYHDMVPVFKRLERNEDGASDVYGKNGAVVVSETRGPHPLTKVFVEAVSEVTGCPPNPDYNGEVQVGASVAHVTQKNGWRYSTSRAYLAPARHRANLKIVTHAEVARVVFEGKVAVGVEARIDGELRVLRARREVLLSAGSINSPKLLMLSGIGDPAKLGQFGIPVVHANPWVGRNLQEHPAFQVKALVNVKTSNMESNVAGYIKNAAWFLLRGGGPASHVLPGISFVKSRPELEYPDLEIQFVAFGYDTTEEGLKLLDRPAITLQPNVNRSRSRGRLELRQVAGSARAPTHHARRSLRPRGAGGRRQDIAADPAQPRLCALSRRRVPARRFRPDRRAMGGLRAAMDDAGAPSLRDVQDGRGRPGSGRSAAAGRRRRPAPRDRLGDHSADHERQHQCHLDRDRREGCADGEGGCALNKRGWEDRNVQRSVSSEGSGGGR